MKENYIRCADNSCDMPARDLPVLAFVIPQWYSAMYEPVKALEEGTLFPELNKPYTGGDHL